ncbi:MAG: DUF418 domain-containing protein [Phycisphaerales bacterium]|nr:DUF418 domain-containing protein [Phycisphaerales bacterium]
MDASLAQPLSPLARADRIEGIDFARGIALLGILLVNARFFFWPFASAIAPECSVPGLVTDTSDAVVWTIIEALCTYKFVSLFSILFGFGIAAQASSALRAGVSRWGFGARRFAVLMGFGVLHATLVWYGDILFIYAVFGFLVLAIAACKPKTILVWYFVFAALMMLVAIGSAAAVYFFGTYPELLGDAAVPLAPVEATSGARGFDAMREWFARGQFNFDDPQWMQAEIAALQQGPWLDAALFRVAYWGIGLSAAFFGYGWQAFTMMLFGVYAFRSGLFEVAASARRTRLGWICLCVGVPIALLSLLPFWYWDLRDPCAKACHVLGLTASALILPIAYATLLVEYARRLPPLIRVPIESAGRMALSVYLCESILATAIASWWGLAMFAKLGDAELAVVSLGVWLALVLLAWLWLQRFKIGPAEWLWRRLSYRHRMP